ncbi:MAG TPA: hypothetical protein VLX92_31660 [Kofleriaceae bacterium]|nr:hypothetical protein [Kofleriaceae bacterium]
MRGVLAVVLVGCATATTPNAGQPDAPRGPGDAPRARDGDVPIDGPIASGCASGQTCSGAASLGTVSGDTGADTQQGSGYQSAWYSVRVTENDSSVFAVPMNLTVSLTSPPGSNFDLYVYVDTGTDDVDCTTVTGSSTRTSGVDSVHLTWGETGTFANGSDDSRTVSIEVRAVTTSCSAGATWQLSVAGDE